ncbi:MAG: hypothetical protein AAF985_24110, partial [Bacteroidota bacterium]
TYALKGIQRNVYLNLIQLARKRDKAEQALAYYDQYVNIIDSLYNEEKQVQITNIESRYKFLQKEKELEIAQQQLSILQQESQTNHLFKIIFLLALLLLVSIAWQLIRKKNQKISFKEAELRHAASTTKDLKTEIKHKEKELTSFTLNFVQKNKLFQEIKADIQSIKKDSKASTKSQLSKLERLIDSAVHIDEDWEDFRRYFESTHSGLIANLKTRYPDLTSNDLKLLALVRLNLSTKEIATMLGISPESAKTARYRLRKKLNMTTATNLFNFLLEIESDDLP